MTTPLTRYRISVADSEGETAYEGTLDVPTDGLAQVHIGRADGTPLALIDLTEKVEAGHWPDGEEWDVALTVDPANPNPGRVGTWPTTVDERRAFTSWQYEVANGDTVRGFRDWIAAQLDADAE